MRTGATHPHGDRIEASLAAAARAAGHASPVDFATNINPYGPHPAVVAAARGALDAIASYPDPDASEAREALAVEAGRRPAEVVIGNGAVELIRLATAALAEPGEVALVVVPAFAEYVAAARAARLRVRTLDLDAAAGFALEPGSLLHAIERSRPRLVLLGSPNNPTGTRVEPTALADLASASADTVYLLDESFCALGTHPQDARTALPPNVVRIRSLTKDHAVPGLRVAYLLASARIARRIESVRGPWPTAAPVQAAAAATTRTGDFVEGCRRRLLADRAALAAVLREHGLEPLVTGAPFLLVDVGDAAALRRRLLVEHGVHVRDCASFALPRHLRLAARPEGERARLGHALAAIAATPGRGRDHGPDGTRDAGIKGAANAPARGAPRDGKT